jgi:hypothetical protein
MYKLFFASSILFIIIFIMGCGNDSHIMQPSEMKDYMRVIPRDGETAVRLDQSIEIQFFKPVDRSIVENGFYLISSKDMADSVCPVNSGMNHSEMNTAMMNSMNMNHLVMQHQTGGTFIWMSDTKCFFRPDSLLMPNMEYMMQVSSSMMNMMQEQMGEMNMNNMGTMQHGMMMMHFFTMDTTYNDHLNHHK